jgi:antitoxin component of RelBE/YafQ-DinJ toxin-antitoxin module
MLVVTIEKNDMNAEEKADRRLAARVTAALKSEFNAKAKEIGLNESDALVALAEKFIKGQITIEGKESGDRFQRLESEIEILRKEIAALREVRQGELIVSGSR